MSDPVDGESEKASRPAPPETETPAPTASDSVGGPPSLGGEAEGHGLADAEIPPLQIPEPEIPDPVLPASVLEDPVIPPMPASIASGTAMTPDAADPSAGATASDSSEPTTRAALRALPKASAKVEPAPIPPNPEVVPPPSGGTADDYRLLKTLIFSILILLLMAGVATVVVLLGSGASPFPTGGAAPGWVPPVR